MPRGIQEYYVSTLTIGNDLEECCTRESHNSLYALLCQQLLQSTYDGSMGI